MGSTKFRERGMSSVCFGRELLARRRLSLDSANAPAILMIRNHAARVSVFILLIHVPANPVGDATSYGRPARHHCQWLRSSGLNAVFIWALSQAYIGRRDRRLTESARRPSRCASACQRSTVLPQTRDLGSLPALQRALVRLFPRCQRVALQFGDVREELLCGGLGSISGKDGRVHD